MRTLAITIGSLLTASAAWACSPPPAVPELLLPRLDATGVPVNGVVVGTNEYPGAGAAGVSLAVTSGLAPVAVTLESGPDDAWILRPDAPLAAFTSYTVLVDELPALAFTTGDTEDLVAPDAPDVPELDVGAYHDGSPGTSCEGPDWRDVHVSWTSPADPRPIVFDVEVTESVSGPIIAPPRATAGTTASFFGSPGEEVSAAVCAIDEAGSITCGEPATLTLEPSFTDGTCSCTVAESRRPSLAHLLLALVAVAAIGARRRPASGSRPARLPNRARTGCSGRG